MRRRLKLQVKPNVAPKAARGPGTSSEAEAPEVKTEVEPKETATETETKVSVPGVEEEPKTEKQDIEKDVQDAPTSEVEDKTDVQKKDEKTVQAKSGPGSSRRSRIRPQVQIRGRGPSNANSTPAVSKPEQLKTEAPSSGEATGAVANKQDEEEEADIQEVPAVKVLRIAKPAPVKKTASKEKTVKETKAAESDTASVSEVKTEAQTIPKSPVKDPQQAAARRSRFLKARPNLVEAGRARLRHPSMSQSDVVEESPRKAPPPVQRAAAALSSSATVGKNSETQQSGQKEGNVPAPSMKPDTKLDTVDGASAHLKPSANYVDYPIVKSRHEAPTRKRRKVETVEEPIDRSKVTMKDLIYMNPSCNRMKSTVEEEERRWKEREKRGNKGVGVEAEHVKENVAVDEAKDAVDGRAAKAEKAGDDTMETENPEEEGDPEVAEEEAGEEEGEGGSMPVPQVSIGPDGEIILNEASLVIQNKPEKTVDVHSPIIHERDGNFTYAYRRRRRTKLWNLKETKKFYVALSTIGTDFSLMEKFFPNRDRTDLKKKFKREEKSNRVLVDRALQERHNFDVSVFDEDSDNEDEKKEKKKRGRRASRKRAPAAEKKTPSRAKRKTKSRYYSSESENDDIVVETPRSGKAAEISVAKAGLEGGVQQGTPTIRIIKRDRPSPRLNSSHDADENGTTVMSTPARQTGGSPGPLKSPGSAKSPGQFISLSKVNQSGNVNVNQMHPGQFVFVTSTPPAAKEGQKPVQLIHVYRVSPSGVLNREPSPAGPGGALSLPMHGINRPSLAGFSPATTFYGTPKPAQLLQDKGSPFITPSPVSRRQTPCAAVPSTSAQGPQIVQISPQTQPVGNRVEDKGITRLEEPVFQKPETPKGRLAEGQQKMMKVVAAAAASPMCSDSLERIISPVASSTPLGQRTLVTDTSSPSFSQRTEASNSRSTSSGRRTDAINAPSTPISQRTVAGFSRSPEVISLLDESPMRIQKQSPVQSPEGTTISANISVPVNAGLLDSESGNIVTDITHLVQSSFSSAAPCQEATDYPLEGASPRFIQTLDVDIPPGIDPSRIISLSPQTSSNSPSVELPVVNVSSPELVLDAERSMTSALPSPPGGATLELLPRDHKKAEFGCSIVNNSQAQSSHLFKAEQDLTQQSVDASPQSEASQGAGPESEGAGPITVTMETQDSMETEDQTIECEIVQSGDDENEGEGNYIVVEWLPGEEDSS